MFLDLLRRRNPHFIAASVRLHQRGELPANTYALDLDAIKHNASIFQETARPLGLTTFAMTKQVGRNPDFCRTLLSSGISEAVCVDLDCAIAAHKAGLRIGHLGHLVQIPQHDAHRAASLRPRFWTVFSHTKATQAAAAAREIGDEQALLARVVGAEDRFYPGHEGGFDVRDVEQVAADLDRLDGAEFAGITTFPCHVFNANTKKLESTPNLATLEAAARSLQRLSLDSIEVNAPGTTSVAALPSLSSAGATQVEPGHGLTGTTPWHAYEDLPEKPAVLYVSEVSHLHQGRAYIFGGGLYVDPVIDRQVTRALVIPAGGGLDDAATLEVDMPNPAAIDYYATAPTHNHTVAAGDTVIFGFRPQVFVTRAMTAGISGIDAGRATVGDLYAADGSPALRGQPEVLPTQISDPSTEETA